MNFIFGLDQDFVMPTGVAIGSLDRFLSDQDTIIVLGTGLTDRHREDLRACSHNAAMQHIDCTGMADPVWTPSDYLSGATFLRFLAPDLLSDVQRAVYLDGDLIVRRNPREMHDIDLCGRSAAAVRSRVTPFAASAGGIRRWFDLQIPSTSPYFNAGVLVMDLDSWRRNNVIRRATAFLRRYGADAWIPDQEALNVALIGDWVPLDRTWNYVTHVAESFLQQPELEPQDPHIVHFAGRLKPWTWGRPPLFAEDWSTVLGATPWSAFEPTPPQRKRGPRAALRRSAGRLLRVLRRLGRDD